MKIKLLQAEGFDLSRVQKKYQSAVNTVLTSPYSQKLEVLDNALFEQISRRFSTDSKVKIVEQKIAKVVETNQGFNDTSWNE